MSPTEDFLINDVLTLLHAREQKLTTELAKLEEIKQVFVPGAGTTISVAEAATDGNGAITAPRTRRPMSPAARKAISRRMKALWRTRKRPAAK
jgi:hypothetical protein